jgi:hypothetical protein
VRGEGVAFALADQGVGRVGWRKGCVVVVVVVVVVPDDNATGSGG